MRARTPQAVGAVLALLATLGPGGGADAQVIRAGPKACRGVALTFDMCPVRGGGGYDAALVASLVAERTPATFFLSGRWMATHDEEVRALLAAPFFEVGTHGQAHAHLPQLDAAAQRAEIEGPIVRLRTTYGRETVLFRPPYGEYDETTVDLAARLGLRFILWNAVSGDPDPSLSAEAIVRHLSEVVRPGGIIVFHANGKGRHTREVVEALRADLLARRGLEPMTVTDLLDRCGEGRTHGDHH
jgi:peptidoglycan/xylan/chitin deacetylase (PgdA/CDA1 family)